MFHFDARTHYLTIVSQSYRRLRNTPGQLYSWEAFSTEFSLPLLLERLEITSIFARGLPRNIELQNRRTARIFSRALRDYSISIVVSSSEDAESSSEDAIADGSISIVESSSGESMANDSVDTKTLDLCFRRGWLHTEKLIEGHGRRESIVYMFPSPLHRWYVEWKLYDKLLRPFESESVLQLVIDVVYGFFPSYLSGERRVNPEYIQRPPEAQYQDEFYWSCYNISNGSLKTSPEFSTAEGRIDFYIPSKNWGVEFLRNGDRLKGHNDRFLPSGPYGANLVISDYIILDCRAKWPRDQHPGMCITCQSIHLLFFQANLMHRLPQIVPRYLPR